MKLKGISIKVVLIIILLFIGIKVYYEVDSYIFINNSKLKNKMEIIESKIEHKTLNLEGYDIHYYVSGDKGKDLIIFLHPAFSDHRAFDLQLDYFSKDYRVITIDLIGHGLSKVNKSNDKIDASSQHINKILEIEGYKKAHLVGISMGSLIAQHFAYQYPNNISSLTALGGYTIHKENKEVEKAQRSVNFSLIFRAIFSMKSFRKKAAEITCKSEKGRAFFYKTASLYNRKSLMVMQGLQKIIQNRDSINTLYKTLILMAEFDIELAKKMAKEWHSETKNSNFMIIKDAGHCANIDQPNDFNIIVKEFIDMKK